MEQKYILSRPWRKDVWYYVDSPPERAGDWGYTADAGKAVALSGYWKARFEADCARVGVQSNSLAVTESL